MVVETCPFDGPVMQQSADILLMIGFYFTLDEINIVK